MSDDERDDPDAEGDDQLDYAIDPELMARIISAFGEPTPPREPVARPPREPEPGPDPARMRALLEAIDPRLIDRVEEHQSRAAAHSPAYIGPKPGRLGGFDRAAWPIDREYGTRQMNCPPDIYQCLDENVPQALLRDLHRPETEFAMNFAAARRSEESVLEARAAVAEAMQMSHKPALIRSSTESLDARAALRAKHRDSWQSLLLSARIPEGESRDAEEFDRSPGTPSDRDS